MLVYLYGIVAADAQEPPAELQGLEGAAVRLLRVGPVAGIVGELDPTGYSSEQLDARLADIGWVGERGIAHERVLTWFADRGPVIPLQPFSLHASSDAVRARLTDGGAHFARVLQRLAGRREWGIKLWADEGEVLAHLQEISPAVSEIEEAMRDAPPGRRFLLTKKRDSLAAEELRIASLDVARYVYDSLAELTDAALRHPIPPPGHGEKLLLLHAAYLVREDRYDDFRDRVSELSKRFGQIGFSVEFTGPWPPYHFTDLPEA